MLLTMKQEVDPPGVCLSASIIFKDGCKGPPSTGVFAKTKKSPRARSPEKKKNNKYIIIN